MPLSVTMLLGTPNRKTIHLMKFTADVASAEVTGIASIHLMNLSTATSRYMCPPGQDLCNFPIISSPHCAKGHAKGIGINSAAGE